VSPWKPQARDGKRKVDIVGLALPGALHGDAPWCRAEQVIEREHAGAPGRRKEQNFDGFMSSDVRIARRSLP
jgi:hypothetical protein